MKAVHYNYALRPNKNTLPLCQIGAIGKNRDFSKYRATTNEGRVTCKRCRRSLRGAA